MNTPIPGVQQVSDEDAVIKSISEPTLFKVDHAPSDAHPAEQKGARPAWTYRAAWRNMMRDAQVQRPWIKDKTTHRLMLPAPRPNAKRREMITI